MPFDLERWLSDLGLPQYIEKPIGPQCPVPPDAVRNLDTIGDLQFLEGIAVRPAKKCRNCLKPP